MFEKISFKSVLKWTTFSILVFIMGRIVWSLVEELQSVDEFQKDIKDEHRKEAEDDFREWRVSVWALHTLYFAYILMAIYAVVKENYPLLLWFTVVDFILNFIYIFDFDGVVETLFDMSVTVICLITTVYFKYQQNIPWNPF